MVPASQRRTCRLLSRQGCRKSCGTKRPTPERSSGRTRERVLIDNKRAGEDAPSKVSGDAKSRCRTPSRAGQARGLSGPPPPWKADDVRTLGRKGSHRSSPNGLLHPHWRETARWWPSRLSWQQLDGPRRPTGVGSPRGGAERPGEPTQGLESGTRGSFATERGEEGAEACPRCAREPEASRIAPCGSMSDMRYPSKPT
jgi:hypothetical protein